MRPYIWIDDLIRTDHICTKSPNACVNMSWSPILDHFRQHHYTLLILLFPPKPHYSPERISTSLMDFFKSALFCGLFFQYLNLPRLYRFARCSTMYFLVVLIDDSYFTLLLLLLLTWSLFLKPSSSYRMTDKIQTWSSLPNITYDMELFIPAVHILENLNSNLVRTSIEACRDYWQLSKENLSLKII